MRRFVVTIAIIGGIAYFATREQPTTSASASNTQASVSETDSNPPPNPCETNWKQCKDNSDMANNYRNWSDVQIGCKYAANNKAKYGSPTWPWFPFTSFRPGSDYPKTGIVTAVEPDAQFQNSYGAYEHVRVVCVYDLTSQRKPWDENVKSITLTQR